MGSINRDQQRKAGSPYKLRRRTTKYSTSSTVNTDYGPSSQQPDVDSDELRRLCTEYYEREVAVASDRRAVIEHETRLQSETSMWYHQRRIRLTASNFGKVAKRRPTTPVANLVKSLLYSKSIESSSLRWGKVHEPDAREAYKAYLKLTDESTLSVDQSGLVVDDDIPCLACSPDGLVGTNGLVEYKCPYKAAQLHLTPLEASNSIKDFCSTSDGQNLHLKSTHHYYYQVQGCLAITKRNWYDFMIWTPQGISVERIYADSKFWNNTKEKLERFYRSAILPDLALPRYTSKQPIREPFNETRA